MDQIKKRMEALRVEADESSARAEELKAKVKQLESETTQKGAGDYVAVAQEPGARERG
ncbi:tropomyosin [Pyrenophora tritici-repentis]|nr:tropomyosin [Pyrenophora tritici-repentis]